MKRFPLKSLKFSGKLPSLGFSAARVRQNLEKIVAKMRQKCGKYETGWFRSSEMLGKITGQLKKQFRAQGAKYERLKFIFPRLPETIMVLSAIIIQHSHTQG